jgi:serine/threonine protein kinase
MKSRRRPASAPADVEQLRLALRSAGLLPAGDADRLADRWNADGLGDDLSADAEVRLRAQQLVDDGRLTPWQAAAVLAGDAARLRLGPYLLLDWLGDGGMSRVYKAVHRLLHRVVALKVVAAVPSRRRRRRALALPGGGRRVPGSPARGGEVRLPASRDALVHFRREVEAATRLNHPNIVAAVDAARAGGVFFLVLEYVEGVDLGRLIAEAGPLPIRLACEAGRQAARALQYAHEQGLLHCDVKPANLLLAHPERPIWGPDDLRDLAEPHGPPPVVKLLDLGLSRLNHANNEGPDALDGTPDYLAPERGHGGTFDGRSDLYSLGCTLYHLLTGQAPFPGGDWKTKLVSHRLNDPEDVATLRPDTPPEIASVVRRLMQRDPDARYSSAGAPADALENWLAGRGDTDAGVVVPATAPESPWPAAAPSRGPRVSGFAVAVAVAAGLLLAMTLRLAWPWRATAAKSEPPATVTQPGTSPAASGAFAVDGLSNGFATLAAAVAAAPDGGTITIRGPGPHALKPLSWRGKALSLRAAAGDRPVLELAGGDAPPWQALLAADRDLTLDGLELHRAGGDAAGRLVVVEGAMLRATDCRFVAAGVAIVHRQGGRLELRCCRVEGGPVAVSVEVGEQPTCEVQLMDSVVAAKSPGGVGLSVWARDARRATDVTLRVEGGGVSATRAVALTTTPGRVRIIAEGATLAFRESVLSFSGAPAAWRRTTSWQGRDNHFRGAGAWIRVEDEPLVVGDIASWRTFWGDAEPGSVAKDE